MNGRNALQEELMTTIKLTIEYDGSRYPGFSTKKKSASIESKLTLAIRDVTGQSTQLFAAVKTEPGVHATHQIVSFQLEKESFSVNTELLKMKLNAALPAAISRLSFTAWIQLSPIPSICAFT